MELTNVERAFVYGSRVLAALEQAGTLFVSLEIYHDASCSLIMPEGISGNIRSLAEELLSSDRWEIHCKGYIKLSSCGGLLQGGSKLTE